MQSWTSEVYRSLVQILYWREYRYAEGRNGTLLDLECDILAQEIEAEENGGPEVEIGNDWLRRYEAGGWRRKTGHYYFTTPRPDRLKTVLDFVERSGHVTRAAVEEHIGDAARAQRIAAERGYDLFGDQRILAGTFRGMFHGSICVDEPVIEVILLIHFIPGEAYFRTRLLQVAYHRRNADRLETGESSLKRWSQLIVKNDDS